MLTPRNNDHDDDDNGDDDQDKSKRQRMTTTLTSATTTVEHNLRSPRAARLAATKRKRKYKLSRRQQQRWLEKEADDSRIYNLVLDVNELKQQVQRLVTEKRAFETRAAISRHNIERAAVQTVEHLFRPPTCGVHRMQSDEQRFSAPRTLEDAAVNITVFGRDVLVRQWERYAHIFSVHAFRTTSVTTLSSDTEYTIVCCNSKFDGHISRTTVEIVFPHIVANEALVQRIVGQRIRVPVKTLVYVDASNRTVRLDAKVDLFEGLNSLSVLSPRDAIAMVVSTQINDGCRRIPSQVLSNSELTQQQQVELSSVSSSAEDHLESARPASPPDSDDRYSIKHILS